VIVVYVAVSLAIASEASSNDVHLVNQVNRAFAPSEIAVKLGDVVVFKNSDKVTHNMFSRTKGPEFNLKMQKPNVDKPNVDKSVEIKNVGEHVIRCAIHPKMKLTVRVSKY
jgi:plastocyanin